MPLISSAQNSLAGDTALRNEPFVKTFSSEFEGDRNHVTEEEKRLQESFKAIKSQQVAITVDSVQIDGGQATVKVTRQDTINGKSVKPIQQVFRLGQATGSWAIQAIGIQ